MFMSNGKKIVKNTFILTSGQIFSKILNLIILLILTRMLGRDGFGLYSFALAFGSMFMLFTHFGIHSLLVRDIARDRGKANEYVNFTLSAVLIFSFGTFFLINLIAYITGWILSERIIIFIVSFYVILDAISRYFISIFRAFERMEYEVLVNMTDRIGLLICALLVWLLNFNLVTLVTGFSFIGMAKALTAFLILRSKFIRPKLRWSFNFISPLLKEAYPFALVGLFTSVTIKIDTILLKYFHTDDIVGIYNAGRKLIESLSFIPESIYYAVFPTLSALFIIDRTKFSQTFQQSLKYMIIVAIPITTGLFFLAPQIIQILYDPEFYNAFIPLRWLSIALGILFCKHILAVTLNAAGKQYLLAIISGIALLINVLLNFLLIPKHSYLGASLSLIVSEALIAIISYIFIQRLIKFSNFKTVIFKMIIAGAGMIMIMIFLKISNIFLVFILSIIFYGVAIYFLRVFSSEEYLFFYNLFKNKFKISK